MLEKALLARLLLFDKWGIFTVFLIEDASIFFYASESFTSEILAY
jgi:hypothetical protein